VDAQGDKIREAAKWLVASFAAVGAALIAGSQLSSIGRLPVCAPTSIDCIRLWIAILGAVVALLGVVWAVWTGVGLLAPIRLQASDLKMEWRAGTPIHAYFQANPAQLQGFIDFEDMDTQEKGAYDRFDELNAQLDEVSDAQRLRFYRKVRTSPAQRKRMEKDLDEAEETLNEILRRSDDVITIANHVQYVHFFRGKALRRVFAAAAIAAVGIVAFAWAGNPPSRAPVAALRGADLSGADLSGANLRNVDLTDAVLSGANLTDADLDGADLTGTDLTDVLWSGTTCPDGTNSDDAAGSCENHLQADSPSSQSGGS
jgi:hypothetical protein